MNIARTQNIGTILNLIRESGPISKKEIAANLNITRAAVTIICNDLIEMKYLEPVGEKKSNKAGRNEILLDLNYNFKYIFGIKLEREEISITLSNLKPDLLVLEKYDIKKFRNEILLIEFLIERINLILKEKNMTAGDIIGLGLSVVGKVDLEHSRSLNTYGVFPDKEINWKELIESKTDINVVVDNNVNCLALSEIYIRNKRNNFLFLKYGPKLGGAVIFDREFFSQKSNDMAEIGHFLIKHGGRYIYIEDLISYERIVNAIIDNVSGFQVFHKKYKNIPKNKVIKNFLEVCTDKSTNEFKYLKYVVEMLALVIYNSSNLVNFDRVILYGEIFEKEMIIDIINDFFKQHEKYDIVVEKSILPVDFSLGPNYMILNEMLFKKY
jgi:predicted NBD/HSP70 family sugar kinase